MRPTQSCRYVDRSSNEVQRRDHAATMHLSILFPDGSSARCIHIFVTGGPVHLQIRLARTLPSRSHSQPNPTSQALVAWHCGLGQSRPLGRSAVNRCIASGVFPHRAVPRAPLPKLMAGAHHFFLLRLFAAQPISARPEASLPHTHHSSADHRPSVFRRRLVSLARSAR